ncbi:unknown [Crocosphaera subtropica ATCC 51142]|uniref:Uncharacterized protein n=1 Tax=Crocosphaera subtropica (strain ATCC 51142 / BH68) TaxID=43989 RepID=B1X1J3_CROS5|nr:hypothetical protein [Crocosphaera subtropica]ACB51422.1 unknown [Crocosphaera subtropica ATCC 51142]
MKLTYLSAGLLSVTSLFCLTLVNPELASAQCVQSHTGVQVHMGQTPAEQTHNTRFENQGDCTGNASSTTSTQVQVGGDNVRQHQESRHQTRGSSRNPSGVSGPTVSVDTVAPVDVQTPENFPY